MSSSNSKSSAIICKEVFDESSQASEEEIIEYAKRLGIDPKTEPYLLGLAKEGLMAPLPMNWKPVLHENSGMYYYYDESTKRTTWEHPMDEVYKKLIAEARFNHRQLEASLDGEDEISKIPVPDEFIGPNVAMVVAMHAKPPPGPSSGNRVPLRLAPLRRNVSDVGVAGVTGAKNIESPGKPGTVVTRKEASSPLGSPSGTQVEYRNRRFNDPEFYSSPNRLTKKLSEVLRRSESLSPRHEMDWKALRHKFGSDENVIDVDAISPIRSRELSITVAETPFNGTADQQQQEVKMREKSSTQTSTKELRLSGDGALFLKRNRSRDTTPSREQQELPGASGDGTGDNKQPTKSILRDKVVPDSSDIDAEKTPTMEEERKSVRFDLNRMTAGISFDYLSRNSEDDPEQNQDNNAKDMRGLSLFSVSQILQRQSSSKRFETRSFDDSLTDTTTTTENNNNNLKNIGNTNNSTNGTNGTAKPSKLVAHRFVVENVTDSEHLQQYEKNNVPNHEENLVVNHSDDELSANDVSDDYEVGNFETELAERKLALQAAMRDRLAHLKREMIELEEREVQKLKIQMDQSRAESLRRVKSELEACYEKERQEVLASLKQELDDRKKELLQLRSLEIDKLENEHEKSLDDGKRAKILQFEHEEKLEALKRELERELDAKKIEMRALQREKINKITEDHEKCLADILKDFRTDEVLSRKVHKQRLDEIRADYARDLENALRKQNESAVRQEVIDFEKIRCEKRLLEDKYNILKEKYLKLKKDMRMAVEKRIKRRETQQLQANASPNVQVNATAVIAGTMSETEMSTSTRTRTDKTESDQSALQSRTNSYSSSKPIKCKDGQQQLRQSHSLKEIFQHQHDPAQQQTANTGKPPTRGGGQHRRTRSHFTIEYHRLADLQQFQVPKPLETNLDDLANSKTISNNNTIDFALKWRNISGRLTTTTPTDLYGAGGDTNENPVESMRKQLEKLEDISDRLPTPTNVPSELEFFRHRIHVERDSVKRARAALRQQKIAFQSRLRASRELQDKSSLSQVIKEQRELSEVEVSLHRTRSLLGEKIIYLRHLEESLERMSEGRHPENAEQLGMSRSDDMTLSDLSSASSGFSSTDLAMDNLAEPTEIVANLESLNSEIREIWGALNKSQDQNLPQPSPGLMCPDFSLTPYYQFHNHYANQYHQPNQATINSVFGTPNIQSNILSQLTSTSPSTGPIATQNIVSQYGPNSGFTTSVGTVESAASSVLERTKHLKDWLRQSRVDNFDLASPGQTTL